MTCKKCDRCERTTLEIIKENCPGAVVDTGVLENIKIKQESDSPPGSYYQAPTLHGQFIGNILQEFDGMEVTIIAIPNKEDSNDPR